MKNWKINGLNLINWNLKYWKSLHTGPWKIRLAQALGILFQLYWSMHICLICTTVNASLSCHHYFYSFIFHISIAILFSAFFCISYYASSPMPLIIVQLGSSPNPKPNPWFWTNTKLTFKPPTTTQTFFLEVIVLGSWKFLFKTTVLNS